jgi:hypothetical protein
MKIQTNWILLLLLCSTIIFTNCSKDKRIERNLDKNGGKWNIDQVGWEVVEQSSSGGQTFNSGNTTDAGNFTFDKDGSGSYSYEIDGKKMEGTFDWSVDDQKVTISYVGQSVDYGTGAVNQKVVAYTGTLPSKTELLISGTETSQYTSGSITQSVLTAGFNLTKE